MMSLETIEKARRRIAPHILATPLVVLSALSRLTGADVALKLEHRQTTGSFKLRGATNAVLQLSEAEWQRGVIAASTGNHGRARSYAARALDARATICMSHLVPENKVAEIRRLGARVRIVGSSQDDAQAEVDRLVAKEGLTMIPPFDDPRIIAGQGTLGLDILDAVADVTMVLVPLSGGGLAAGVAAAIKGARPDTRAIGLTMEAGAAMKASLDAGHPVQVEEHRSLADSLGGGIGLQNCWTFRLCRELLDEVVLVSESEIAAGIRHAYGCEHEMIEGAGAVGIAALLAGKVPTAGETIVAILSGGNIDPSLHRRVLQGLATTDEDS